MKRRVADRRAKLRRIAERDARNRCPICKRSLPPVGVHVRWNDPALYCSPDCLQAAEEREALR